MTPPTAVDEYLVAAPEPIRPALERLRSTRGAAALGAAETIAYGVPAPE